MLRFGKSKHPAAKKEIDKWRSNLEGNEKSADTISVDMDWVPMSRNQKTRRPIHSQTFRKSSRIQDWVNFNIKSLGGETSQDENSDSGFEQSTKSNDYHSLYVEPWTNCHEDKKQQQFQSLQFDAKDKVRIFVAGPSPQLEKRKNQQQSSYKSAGPNDERFYVTDKPTTVRHHHRKKKKIAPQPPASSDSVTSSKRSIGLQTDNHETSIYSSVVNNNMSTARTKSHINKKTYLFATSSNEMAFPNSMPSTKLNRRNEALTNDDTRNPSIPEPDYSPIIIRKPRSHKTEKRNYQLWGNAARYRGSLEELDQEEISPDESQGSSSVKVRQMVEQLKFQADRDRRKQLARQQGGFTSLRPLSKKESRRSMSEDREDSVLSDSFSMLSMSNSNIQFGNTRMSQYSPGNWSSSSRSSLPVLPHDDPSSVSMMPCSHEQSMLDDVKGKQSHFFNSLFPSRANRFGFPVYPERTFGIPSQMNVPVSFAGFSPEPSGAKQSQQQQSSMLYYNSTNEPEESSSILSDLPKLLMGRKKKYNVKKSRRGIFGLF